MSRKLLSRTLVGLTVLMTLLIPTAFAQDALNNSAFDAMDDLTILRAQARNLASEFAEKKAAYEDAKQRHNIDAHSESLLNNAKFQYVLIERKYNEKKAELLTAELALEQLRTQQAAFPQSTAAYSDKLLQKNAELSNLKTALLKREQRIAGLQYELGKLRAQAARTRADNTHNQRDELTRLNSQLTDYENEINALRTRLVNIVSEQEITTDFDCDCPQQQSPAFIVARDTGMNDEQRTRFQRVLQTPSYFDSQQDREIKLHYAGANTYQLWQRLQYLGEGLYQAEATVMKGELLIRVGDWYWQSEIASSDHQRNISFILDTRGDAAQLFIHRGDSAFLALH